MTGEFSQQVANIFGMDVTISRLSLLQIPNVLVQREVVCTLEQAVTDSIQVSSSYWWLLKGTS
jgi:hypothetical protein